jgi:hypothetical protein
MATIIAAKPPTTPPAMAPVFELCPLAGTGVEELLVDEVEVPVGPVEEEMGVPPGPRSVPGPISVPSKEVRYKCETATRGGRQGRGFPPPRRYDWVAFQSF